MNSPARTQVSLPTWGGRPPSLSAVRGRTRVSDPAARRAPARLELRGPRAFPSEAIAATVLAVLWVVLWATFTEGVVAPAASLRSPEPAAAVATAP